MAVVVDSYSEANQDGGLGRIASASSLNAVGQSFTGGAGTLNSTKFYLSKTGSPTGNAVSYIYTHSGTFGTSSVPTGTALATSDGFDVSALTGSYQLATFVFSAASKITLVAGTKYVAVIEYTGGTQADHYLAAGSDVSSPTHGGNASYFSIGDGWLADTSDAIFYVYSDDPPPKPSNLLLRSVG